ncbi:hypothetical protein HDU99_003174 [Rhizoclosmatium hyalinum]|nr:hypothetical protein HDU99_003174 [Rhizoclosmatium hyalinum]
MKFAILTVSDRVSRGEAVDRSGPALANRVAELGFSVAATACVEDAAPAIQAHVTRWADANVADVVLTTGGTGFGVRDVTPEAVTPILDKLAPGLSTAMLVASLAITPMAALSRPVCGVRKNTIVVTLPGSPKGALENFNALIKVLPHAVELASGGLNAGEATHKAMADATNGSTASVHASHSKAHSNHICHHRSDHVTAPDQPISAFGLSGDLNAPVSNRVRKSLYPLVPYDQALASVIEHTPVLSPTKHNVSEALAGHILAEDVKALDPVPGYRASVVDGYAVISTDGPGVYPVAQVQYAGSNKESKATRLQPGTIARVTTGAMVPEGADAVVMVEDTELVESDSNGEEVQVRIIVSVRCKENIREIGQDAAVGELIIEKGSSVSAAGGEVGLMASVGVTEVMAYPHPIITILSTGNELVHFSTPAPLAPPFVRDTNLPSLSTAIKSTMPYCTIIPAPSVAKDTQDSLYTLLKSAIESTANVIITTGGVSMGEADMMKGVLEQRLGAQIWFGRVLMKPGKPSTFATVKDANGKTKLVFSLPGNPVSALVGYYVFVLPALRKMAGYASPHIPSVLATLAHSIQLDSRPEFYRVRINAETKAGMLSTRFIAYGTGSQMSSRMLSMRGANALLKLPGASDKVKELKEGDVVEAYIIADF